MSLLDTLVRAEAVPEQGGMRQREEQVRFCKDRGL